MAKNDPLPQKYQKALKFISEGNHSYKDIAKLCGINLSNFYDLIEGTADNLGTIQEKFTKELEVSRKQTDKEIRDLVKVNKKETQLLIQSWLIDQKKLKKVDNKQMGTLVSVANALAKSTPNVEIGSFSYTRGLSVEDLYAEFTRLNGLLSDQGKGLPDRKPD